MIARSEYLFKLEKKTIFDVNFLFSVEVFLIFLEVLINISFYFK